MCDITVDSKGQTDLPIPVVDSKKAGFFEKINSLAKYAFDRLGEICNFSKNAYWLINRIKDLKNNEDGLIKSSQIIVALLQLIHIHTGHTVNPKLGKILDALQTFYSFGFFRLPNTIFGYVTNNTIDNLAKLKVKFAEKIIELAPKSKAAAKAKEVADAIIKSTLNDNKGYWDIERPKGIRSWSPLSYYKDALKFQLTLQGIEDTIAQKIVDELEIKLKSGPTHESTFIEKVRFCAQTILQAFSTICFALVDLGCFLFIPVEVALKFESIANSIGKYPIMDHMLTGIRVACVAGYSSSFINALITLVSTWINEKNEKTRNAVVSKAIIDTVSNSTEVVLNILGLLDVNRTLFLIWTILAKSMTVLGIFVEIVKTSPPKFNEGKS